MYWLVGHLIGDYLFQNDWIAKNKRWSNDKSMSVFVSLLHGMLWAFAIALCAHVKSIHNPWHIYVIVGALHAIQDCFGVAGCLMKQLHLFQAFNCSMPKNISLNCPGSLEDAISRSIYFPIYFWGQIVVDNTLHLVMLFVLMN